LPCNFGKAHGSVAFAGRNVAERPLPNERARQSLCRADFVLCRAICLHGNAQLCRSASIYPFIKFTS
jgi:hypothetical protein